MKAILVHACGGPDQLRYEEVPTPAPGPGQALVKVAAAGVNFIDIYHRTGLYKLPTPIALGMEGAGTVEAVGPDVREFAPGDRVAWAWGGGSYAEYAALPASALVKIPDRIEFQTAAAVMLQGMTAHYLALSTYPIKERETALVHAAAGGVGLLLTQIIKMQGGRVIGTVSTQAKADLALAAGADAVIFYTRQDFEPEVKRLTGGRGVDVVYDSVGAATFMKSLNSLRPRGMLVSFGQSSGPVPPFDLLLLNQKGSLFVTRPKLQDYCATRLELLWRADDVLGWVDSGKLKVRIDKTYPLSEAAQAHRDLEGRKTSGKLLLIPGS
ncbi:MAG TPA: quinone oxidoreductase [Bryobacteraceae bacterium]|nr:quinone oxidoreductase [Bryobacteraceae bacterium]HOL70742.1 quinone oxidoreductase [Bryobacteraceae bacterium]HOQ46812.1 quinone oxidoreductase [Bryobacteraceae bacterium]HPU73602.1 quinone oxidoreductase [Bryobacteraceae bacterium]